MSILRLDRVDILAAEIQRAAPSDRFLLCLTFSMFHGNRLENWRLIMARQLRASFFDQTQLRVYKADMMTWRNLHFMWYFKLLVKLRKVEIAWRQPLSELVFMGSGLEDVLNFVKRPSWNKRMRRQQSSEDESLSHEVFFSRCASSGAGVVDRIIPISSSSTAPKS
ncbi:hypothetical protein R1flu_005053 [Riccia fluitans]|uniref:Uncharacterized protein n=1 Tax=Riccia fluitans TaxID=41844 RepID=A0ABD1YS16_9MARC